MAAASRNGARRYPSLRNNTQQDSECLRARDRSDELARALRSVGIDVDLQGYADATAAQHAIEERHVDDHARVQVGSVVFIEATCEAEWMLRTALARLMVSRLHRGPIGSAELIDLKAAEEAEKEAKGAAKEAKRAERAAKKGAAKSATNGVSS